MRDRFNTEMYGWWKYYKYQDDASNMISTKIMNACYKESQELQKNYEKNKN
jgi:hypothetical protein